MEITNTAKHDLKVVRKIALKVREAERHALRLSEKSESLKREAYLRSKLVLFWKPEAKLPNSYRPRQVTEQTAKIRASILKILLSRGIFHIDDLDEATPSKTAADVVKTIVDRGIIVKAGQKQGKSGRKSNIYRLVDREAAERLKQSAELAIFAELGIRREWITQEEVKEFYDQWFEKPFQND